MKQQLRLRSRQAMLVAYDIGVMILSGYFALLIRFDFSIYLVPDNYATVMVKALPCSIVLSIVIFALFRLYSSLWVYAGVTEIVNIFAGTVLAGLANMVIVFLQNRELMVPLPRSFYVLYTISLMLFVFVSRFAYRGLRTFVRSIEVNKTYRRVLIVGAGYAGEALIREIKNSTSLQKKIVGVIDDDRSKKGSYIRGVKVLGGRDSIIEMAEKYKVDEIIIAISRLTATEMKAILDICKETSCELKRLPAMYQLVNGEISVSKLKEVDVNDLLGREPVQTDLDHVMGYVKDKVIMVTGGGGSIGSELCRQIATYQPTQLIIVDIYENTTYEIQNELQRSFPLLNLVVLIASVRNTKRIDQIFEIYRPEIVFHAAAHKHVPLMEASPNEAVKNNVFGTWKVVQAADKWKVKKFVMISTDKAVNPTNIMGATKRICEMIVQTYNKHSETEFVATRFGNVLGSNGSVIPLFKKQIEAGGPVTVTHPDIIRYFMTIPEAVSLVLQAGAYANGGEIFVLDMGAPVKIVDLARNLILLSGHKPDEDIKIEYVGLRPGEKLYEEMLMAEEGLQETPNKRIHIGKPIEIDEEKFMKQLIELKEYVENEPDDIRRVIKEIVPTYHPGDNR